MTAAILPWARKKKPVKQRCVDGLGAMGLAEQAGFEPAVGY
ncbi:hypothetical protein [Variovorax defluvii]